MSKKTRRPSSKLVLGVGITNALILTFWPDAAVSAAVRIPKGPSAGTGMQVRQVPSGERVNAVQTKGRLSVRVTGKPGRHIGIFWGQNPVISSFKLAPGMGAQIGPKGNVELVLDLASLPVRRYYLQLVCSDDADFQTNRTLTEAVEVRIRTQGSPLIAGHDASGALNRSVTALPHNSLGFKGGGNIIISLPEIRSEKETPASALFPKS